MAFKKGQRVRITEAYPDSEEHGRTGTYVKHNGLCFPHEAEMDGFLDEAPWLFEDDELEVVE